MNRDDIIRMAREANILEPVDLLESNQWRQDTIRELERFASLVAAAERDKYEAKFKQLEAIMQEREQQPNKPCCLAEREACAAICDTTPPYPFRPSIEAAHAIRARGNE